MKDIQNEKDTRNIPLNKVGVNSILYPIQVLDKENKYQHTVARINMYVNLPKEFRGTHMSRFIEVLDEHQNNMSIHNLEQILDNMKTKLDASAAHIEVRFPYFIFKKAPISKIKSFMNYDCAFIASKEEKFDFMLEVNTPVHNLCPCSKEISDVSAHNQRGMAKVQIRMNKLVWIEEVVEISEQSASAPVYSLLKREDEKYITETAYAHPRFVEDLVRNISIELDQDQRITFYSVEAVNFESIHNHNAYASYKKDKRLNK